MNNRYKNLLLSLSILLVFFSVVPSAFAATDRPYVTTSAVSNITPSSAILHGYANGAGSPVYVWFEYGRTPDLGGTTSVEYGGGATNANGYVGGLSANKTYYYRLVADNSYGTFYGTIMSFRTLASGNYIYPNEPRVINYNYIYNTTKNSTDTDTETDSENNSSSSRNSDSSLSASAGSSGFHLIPQTFVGWLVLILVIIVAIILVRMLKKNEYHDRGI